MVQAMGAPKDISAAEVRDVLRRGAKEAQRGGEGATGEGSARFMARLLGEGSAWATWLSAEVPRAASFWLPWMRAIADAERREGSGSRRWDSAGNSAPVPCASASARWRRPGRCTGGLGSWTAVRREWSTDSS